MILALDPGTTETGWCGLSGSRVVMSGTVPNAEALRMVAAIGDEWNVLAIEMFAGMGMIVGQEVFDTCRWIGRFQQAWRDPEAVRLVFRRTVKLHLCGSPQAKDANIRQALIDRLGPPGTKKNPGPTYGVASHAWSALAIAVTVYDQMKGELQ